jgi:hypothetical protein
MRVNGTFATLVSYCFPNTIMYSIQVQTQLEYSSKINFVNLEPQLTPLQFVTLINSHLIIFVWTTGVYGDVRVGINIRV